MADVTSAFEVPSAVASKLRAVRRRGRRIALAAGALRTALVLVAGMTAAVLIDWRVVLFEPAGRIALTAAALAAPLGVFLWICARLLLSPRRLSDAAIQVDRAMPALQERFSTVAELAESRDPPAVRGAAGLIRQVALEAERMHDRVAPDRVIPPDRLRRCGWALVAATLPLAVAMIVSPVTTGTLLARFWLPGRPIALTQVTAQAGDCVVPRGEPMRLEAALAGRVPRHATLFIRRPGRVESVELFPPPGAATRLEHAIPAVREPFDYRVRAGDGQTPWHHVAITDRPGLSGILLRVVPPAYSGLPVDRRDHLPNRCRALRGSRLELALQASKPLARMVVDVRDGPSWPMAEAADAWYRVERVLEDPVTMTVRLVDRHGLENLDPPTCRIAVYEDEPPQVEIVSPAGDVAVRPDETVRIEFKATDDLGLSAAELVVSRGAPAGPQVIETTDIPLPGLPGARFIAGRADLDLRRLGLKPGEQMAYAIRVRDTRSAAATGPSDEGVASQPVSGPAGRTATVPLETTGTRPADGQGCTSSTAQRITVDDRAGLFKGHARRKLQAAVDACLARLGKDLAEAEKQTLNVRDRLQAGAVPDETRAGDLKAASDQLSDAERAAVELKSLCAGAPCALVGLRLDGIARSHVTPARTELTAAALPASDPARRIAHLDRAAFHIARARATLGDAVRQYADLKRELEVEDATRRVARMHQLFIEDMQTLLKLRKGQRWLDPRTGRTVEVTDAFLERLRKHDEQLKALLDELARVLAGDADLLARFMASMRQEGATLREQLARLAGLQRAIAGHVAAWNAAGAGGRAELQRTLGRQLAADQALLAEAAGDLYDNLRTWMPPGPARDAPPLREAPRLAADVASATLKLHKEISAGTLDTALEQGGRLRELLDGLDGRLAAAAGDAPDDGKLAAFVARRLEETARLRRRQANLLERVRQVRQGAPGRALAVAQHELAGDTADLGGRIERAAGLLAGLPAQVADKAKALAEAVRTALPADQIRAAALLLQPQTTPAREAQDRLVADFERAEKRFDELLDHVEQIQARRPPQPPEMPTLDALLQRLREEREACEQLGGVVRLNVERPPDWLSDSTKSGFAAGEATGPGASGRMEDLVRALARGGDALARASEDRIGRLRAATGPAGGATGPADGATRPAAGPPDRDFNVLASRLNDGLAQGRDHAPPEPYRQAIEAYFKTLADLAARRERE